MHAAQIAAITVYIMFSPPKMELLPMLVSVVELIRTTVVPLVCYSIFPLTEDTTINIYIYFLSVVSFVISTEERSTDQIVWICLLKFPVLCYLLYTIRT